MRERKLLIMELRSSGSASAITSVTPRQLFRYIKKVVSLFAEPHPEDDVAGGSASVATDPSAAAPLRRLAGLGGLFGEPLHMRDLRNLQHPFSAKNQPAVTVRLYVVLLNFDPLRTIVLHDRMIVLVPNGADSILDTLQSRLAESLSDRGDSLFGDWSDSGAFDSLAVGHAENEEAESEGTDDDEEEDDDGVYSLHRTRKVESFPFRAVEATLKVVLEFMERDIVDLSARVNAVMALLEKKGSKVATDVLGHLRGLKNRMAAEEARANMTKDALDEILSDDEDMALIGFSEPLTAVLERARPPPPPEPEPEPSVQKKNSNAAIFTTPSPRVFGDVRCYYLSGRGEGGGGGGGCEYPRTLRSPAPHAGRGKARPAKVVVEDHEVFELLFEAFLDSVSTLQTALALLHTEVANGEQFHHLQLEMARNRLLTASVCFSLISMFTAIGSFVGSIFGMNLRSGFESSDSAFLLVTAVTSFGIVLGTTLVFGGLQWAGILYGGSSGGSSYI